MARGGWTAETRTEAAPWKIDFPVVPLFCMYILLFLQCLRELFNMMFHFICVSCILYVI